MKKKMAISLIIIVIVSIIIALGIFNVKNIISRFQLSKWNKEVISVEEKNNNSEYSIPYDYEKYANLPINYSEYYASYAYDNSTPEKAIGGVDYVFVGKVNKIIRTEYKFPTQSVIDGEIKTVYMPYTIYNVTVTDNIKGELITNTNIELSQMGGLKEDEQSYLFLKGMGLLSNENYYIFLAYTQEDGTLLIDNANSIVSLGELNNTEKNEIKQVIETDATIPQTTKNPEITPIDIIYKYKEAYKEQIIPEGKTILKSKIYDISSNIEESE